MIGKVTVSSTDYTQFKRRVRKLLPSATDGELYFEWSEGALKAEGGIDYQGIAKRIGNRLEIAFEASLKKMPIGRLVSMFRELDMEMDGVRVPASAAACLNGIRSILNEME